MSRRPSGPLTCGVPFVVYTRMWEIESKGPSLTPGPGAPYDAARRPTDRCHSPRIGTTGGLAVRKCPRLLIGNAWVEHSSDGVIRMVDGLDGITR